MSRMTPEQLAAMQRQAASMSPDMMQQAMNMAQVRAGPRLAAGGLLGRCTAAAAAEARSLLVCASRRQTQPPPHHLHPPHRRRT